MRSERMRTGGEKNNNKTNYATVDFLSDIIRRPKHERYAHVSGYTLFMLQRMFAHYLNSDEAQVDRLMQMRIMLTVQAFKSVRLRL